MKHLQGKEFEFDHQDAAFVECESLMFCLVSREHLQIMAFTLFRPLLDGRFGHQVARAHLFALFCFVGDDMQNVASGHFANGTCLAHVIQLRSLSHCIIRRVK